MITLKGLNKSLHIAPRLYHFFKRFILWAMLLQLIVFLISQAPEITDVIENTLAQWSSSLYRLAVGPMLTEGNRLIHLESGRYVIVDSQCTALSLSATLMAAMFSLPYQWRDKVFAAFLAVSLIQIENIIRITCLFYEVKQPVNNFHLFHLYIWQLINFIVALIIFYSLYNYLNKRLQSVNQ